MSDSFIFLIFNLIPEEIKFYLIPKNQITEDLYNTIIKANGQIINISEESDEALAVYEEFLGEKPSTVINIKIKDLPNLSKNYKIEETVVIGFYM